MLRHRKDQCDKIQYPKTIHNSSALLTYLAIHQGQVLPWWQHLFVSQSMLGKKINRFFKASELQAEEMDRNGQLQNQTKNLMDKDNQSKDLKLKTESLLQDSRTIFSPQKNNPQSWAVRGTCEAISISFNIHFQKLKKVFITFCKILHDSNVSQFRVTVEQLIFLKTHCIKVREAPRSRKLSSRASTVPRRWIWKLLPKRWRLRHKIGQWSSSLRGQQ